MQGNGSNCRGTSVHTHRLHMNLQDVVSACFPGKPYAYMVTRVDKVCESLLQAVHGCLEENRVAGTELYAPSIHYTTSHLHST